MKVKLYMACHHAIATHQHPITTTFALILSPSNLANHTVIGGPVAPSIMTDNLMCKQVDLYLPGMQHLVLRNREKSATGELSKNMTIPL
jgi:hypothetical protein